jgi:hypothetical protein
MNNNVRIICPKCDWEHHGGAYWQCKCGHIWDTFETHGECPACHYIWKHTACPACYKWSRHIDWYRGLDDLIDELNNESKQQIKETLKKTDEHKVILNHLCLNLFAP